MKLIAYTIAGLLVLLASGAASAMEELHVMSPPNYHPPSIVDRFEKDYGVRIRFEYFNSSEEMLARLRADALDDAHIAHAGEERADNRGGARADLIMLRGYNIQYLVSEKLITPLDHALLPNLVNIGKRYRENPNDVGCLYHIPFVVGTLGIVYRVDLIKNFVPAWGYFFNTKNRAAPFTFMDSYRESLGMALLYLGFSYNSQDRAEIEEAADLLEKTAVRPGFLGFHSREQSMRYIREGLAYAAVVFNGDASALLDEDPRLDFVSPKEGSILWTDVYVVNARSDKKEAAHKWLNFIMDPEVAAEIAVFNRGTSPNEAAIAFMPPLIRQNRSVYPEQKVWNNTQVPRSLGAATYIYLDYWSRLKRM